MNPGALLAVLVALALGAGLAYIRLAPDDPAYWHRLPAEIEPTGRDNEVRVFPKAKVDGAPVYAADAQTIARALDDFVMTQPRVTRLAGGPEQLFVTYIERSEFFAFPDYITARFVDLGAARSTIELVSRSRYGQSDLGVNRKRVETWLGTLSSFEAADAPE